MIKFNDFKNNIDEIVVHNSIESFALCLISIFIPIFLYNLNYSLKQIYIYYFLYFVSFAFFSFFSHNFVKLGLKKTLVFRPISLIFFFIWLYSLNKFPNTLNFLAIYNGLITGFYWVAFHCFFAVKTNENNSLERVGVLFSFPKILTIFSPILGGLIITYLGFNPLFFLVSIFLLVSIIPLSKMKDFELDLDFELKNLLNKSFIKYFFGFIAEGVYYAVFAILFPLFVYLYIGKTLEIGFLSFFMSLAGIIAPIVISKACKHKTSKFIKIFSIIEGLLFIMVLFIKTSVSAFLLSFVISIFANFWLLPFYSRLYRHSKHNNSRDLLEFMTLKEIILSLSRASIFLIMYLFNSFDLIFIINSFSRLLLLFF
jgi:MFS family permease